MAAAFLLVPPVPASAHIESFFIEDAAEFEAAIGAPLPFKYSFVSGSIDCAEGEKFLVTAKVIDDDFRQKGRTKGTCTGEPQNWVVNLDWRNTGYGDGCYERAAAKAHTKVNGVPHDEERDILPPTCS